MDTGLTDFFLGISGFLNPTRLEFLPDQEHKNLLLIFKPFSV